MSAVPSDLLLDRLNTDALIEAVLSAPDPRTRAAIIAAVVQDLCTAVEWVHGQAPAANGRTAAELDGVRHLSSTAHQHQRRMTLSVVPAQVTR